MNRLVAPGALALSLAFSLEAPVTSAAASPCSNDTFTIDGSVVTVRACLKEPAAAATAAPPATHRASVAKTPPPMLEETLTVKGQPPLVRSIPLDAAPTEDASRTIDDVPLASLGLARTLHLTLAVRASGIHLEHALLVPGAVTLK